MFSKEIIIELDKIDTIVNHEWITDFHMGNANWQEKLTIRRRDAIIDEPYRFMSFGGDQIDLILAGDPRFRDSSVRIKTRGKQMEAFDEFWNEMYLEQARYIDKFDMEKIWYEQWGNHEYNS